MSRQITAAELAEIVKRLLTGDLGQELSPLKYSLLMTYLADTVCSFCGGKIPHLATAMDDTWYVGIHRNKDMPDDGGVWAGYDDEGDLIEDRTRPRNI